MTPLSEPEILASLEHESPWWQTGQVDTSLRSMQKRAFFGPIRGLLEQTRSVRRALVVRGPRRTGKTVLVHHLIADLIASDVPPSRILYASIDNPVYAGRSLRDLIDLARRNKRIEDDGEIYLFFDEIQYLNEWEVHLKVLVDRHPEYRIVVTGSAAAALDRGTRESGAGRFTSCFLPPLLFSEYLDFIDAGDIVEESNDRIVASDIDLLNRHYEEYRVIGGFPEIVANLEARGDTYRFLFSDIIASVLTRDLPTLYDIADTRELFRLFSRLALRTGNEVNYSELSKTSTVAENTIRKYVDYLRDTFLIRLVTPLNEEGRTFRRLTRFKVHVTTPSIRTAMFGPIADDDPMIGSINETTILAQFPQERAIETIHYARLKRGEIDLVRLHPATLEIEEAVEIKWSDRTWERPSEHRAAIGFIRSQGLDRLTVTTRTAQGTKRFDDVRIDYVPSALYALSVARRTLDSV